MAGEPLLQRPTYLQIAPPDQAGPAIKSAASDAADACKKAVAAASPNAGLITATLVGVTAAYFAPKVFDWAVSRLRGQDDGSSDEIELDFEDEPR